ncbi:MAG: hypothetical protein COT67_02300 [Candidatus Tagabacteria bacterium CG09_land_8_20_14_0_10_41_14]|uniref:Cell division protein FtsL n=2 Tax=Candidatus Tagaibacteriota TaxID=1817918 RepID=A0A2H0WL14_9BACT|nr:MAG: hypothetical protein COT67_02300 [Candidatus Tagabacteria bacterium CG09_land_8_20_14_0_10_41_14]PJE73187.1 MAG: hypothetical protein COV00_01285 [Candidatus Tagabacteria bacterium CG10_big_fil_rev_8_21_14_0_10_40_13]
MNIFIKIETWGKYSKYLFGGLLLSAFILGFLYIYFMNLAVLKTAERNDNLRALTEIKREFQKVEADYITKLNRIDISYARNLGFVEAGPDGYISVSGIAAMGNNYGQELR